MRTDLTNNCLYEFNEVHNIALRESDTGAFYNYGGWTTYGNVYRYNFIHHLNRANGFYCDDGDSGDLFTKNIVQGTIDHFGSIDILVPNAGGGSNYAPVAQMTDEAMEDAMVWNFWHTFWTMRAALNHMIPKGWGRVIAISSVEGKVGKPTISSYVASKHAINGLCKSASKEVGTMGITINALCPGAIETDEMISQGPGAAAAMGLTYEGLLDLFAQESAVKRLNEVEDVAMVAVLLASDAGAGITGSMISIDGGTSPY